MNINEHLAINVMGWTEVGPYCWKDKNSNYVIDGTIWNPLENIEQAFMCLDESRYIARIFYTKSMKCVDLVYKDVVADGTDESLAKAICLALAKATGYVGDSDG